MKAIEYLKERIEIDKTTIRFYQAELKDNEEALREMLKVLDKKK